MRIPAKKSLSIVLSTLLIAVGFAVYFAPQTHAALLTNSSVELSDPRGGQSATYAVTYTFPGTTSIQCIQVKFGTASDLSSAPTGMTTGASFTLSGGGLTQGSWTNYNSTNGTLEIYNGSGEASTATAVTINWASVTNPTANAPFYAQVTTYSSESSTGASCTGVVDQSNIMAITTTGGVSTSVTVDPTISFSVAGSSGAVNGSSDTVNAITTASSMAFGNVSAGGSATAAAQLLTTSTNAAHGYYIYIRDTQALTNGDAVAIRDQSGTPGSPNDFDGSTSQSSFAYTTDSATSGTTMGSNKWAGLTQTNVAIDHQTSPKDAQALNVQYKLQLSNTQAPGTYSNVITYTATPTY